MKDVIGGRYQVLRRLGSGGMASVYLAHDPLLGREVAIKVPRLDGDGETDDEDTLRRFDAELRAIGRLNHPNVVTIYDGGQEDGMPYLVMEPVEGDSLAQLIRREAPLQPEQAVDIARQIADALAYAHRLGIVHRDVKPQNVLIDGSGRVKVTDFGIAKSSELTQAMTGTLLGTPSFIAPEVLTGEAVTPAADIYSVGVVLYQMLTGHVPFESDNPIAAAVRSQREDASPPSEVTPLPAWLDAVVLRALARDPAERYASAEQLAKDLGAQHAPEPGVGSWESGLEETIRWRPIPRDRPGSAVAAYRSASPRSSGSRPPTPGSARQRRRPRIAWLLPVIVVGLIGLGVVFAITHTPGQGSATPSPKAPPPSGAPNLLTNGGLVTNGPQPSGWRLQVFEGREPVRTWHPGGPTNADREITLESASGTDSAWIGNDVSVEPGWKLTLSGFIQTQGVPGDGPGAALWIVCQGPDGKQSGQASSPAIRGSTGWSQVQAQSAVPAGSASCHAQLRLGASGRPTTGVAEFSRIALVAN